MIKQITFDKELRHRSSYLLHVQLTSLCNFKYRYIWTRRGLFLSVASIQTKMGVFIYWTLEILRWIFPLFIIKLTVLSTVIASCGKEKQWYGTCNYRYTWMGHPLAIQRQLSFSVIAQLWITYTIIYMYMLSPWSNTLSSAIIPCLVKSLLREVRMWAYHNVKVTFIRYQWIERCRWQIV